MSAASLAFSRKLLWPFLLILLLVLELCLPLLFNQAGSRFHLPANVTAIGLPLVSLTLGFIFLFWKNVSVADRIQGIHRWLPWLMLAVLAGLGAQQLNQLFKAWPIDYHQSDVIPTIQVLVRRLLGGEVVYQPIEEFGYHLPVTYLPLQWLPFVPAAVLHFDFRWIAYGIWLLAMVLLVRRAYRGATWLPYAAVLVGMAQFWLMLWKVPEIFQNTVELMVSAYYILLVLGICSRRPWVKALVITLCLLSRYSLVLWLPLWFVAEGLSGHWRRAIIASALVAAAVLLLYVLPFLSRNWEALGAGYEYYTIAAAGEWNHLNDAGRPYHLDRGVGLAPYFYDGLSTRPVDARIGVLKQVHLAASLGVVALLGAAYWWLRRRIPLNAFLLGSFKIYLTIFLAFIQVPYIYLMITGAFVSLACVVVLSTNRGEDVSKKKSAILR